MSHENPMWTHMFKLYMGTRINNQIRNNSVNKCRSCVSIASWNNKNCEIMMSKHNSSFFHMLTSSRQSELKLTIMYGNSKFISVQKVRCYSLIEASTKMQQKHFLKWYYLHKAKSAQLYNHLIKACTCSQKLFLSICYYCKSRDEFWLWSRNASESIRDGKKVWENNACFRLIAF